MATLGHVAVGVCAARWRASRQGARPLAVAMLALSALALLDALTTGGLGVEFLWPVDARRFFARSASFRWRRSGRGC